MGRVKGSTGGNKKVVGLKVEQDGYDRPNQCLARIASTRPWRGTCGEAEDSCREISWVGKLVVWEITSLHAIFENLSSWWGWHRLCCMDGLANRCWEEGRLGLGQVGKPHQELSGVASLRFPQDPPGGTCPPPLEFPTLPGTFQTSVRRHQAMTHSQVLFSPLSLPRGWLQIASWNQAPSLHTGRPKQTPELVEALENVVSCLALSAPCTRHRRRFSPCASFQHHQYWPFLSLMRRESGGTGKEVCSLLLLCEPRKETQALHLDIAGKWKCWAGGFYCSLHSGNGVLPQGRGEATLKISCSLGCFPPQSADQIMGAQQWQVQSPLLRDQGKKNLLPVNRNSAPTYTAHIQRSQLGL